MIPVDDDGENDELLWVKAGEPGEKPTIIRQIRSGSSTSSSSRDNSGGSGIQRKNLLTVENGTVYRSVAHHSSESLSLLDANIVNRTSSSDSRVIVVTVNEQIYPANVDRTRIQKWRELHSPNISKKNTNPNYKNTSNNKDCSKRPVSQPDKQNNIKCSPDIKRCASAEPGSNPRIKSVRSRDEGYTSLSEDLKDSDTDSIRSKSLPSSWKPLYLDQRACELSLHKYATRMTSNNSDTIDFNNSLNSKEKRFLKKNIKKDEKCGKRRYQVENIIEACTCFVCLRSVVYHTEDEDDTDSLVDHPCSCSDSCSTPCCKRWSMITAVTCFLPFLIFYPPLKLCLSIHDYRRKRKLIRKQKNRERRKSKKQNLSLEEHL